jgi:hypothetical protein
MVARPHPTLLTEMEDGEICVQNRVGAGCHSSTNTARGRRGRSEHRCCLLGGTVAGSPSMCHHCTNRQYFLQIYIKGSHKPVALFSESWRSVSSSENACRPVDVPPIVNNVKRPLHVRPSKLPGGELS